MSTMPKSEAENDRRAAKIRQLIRRLRPGDEIVFEAAGTGRVEQSHVVTKVDVVDEEYRVYTAGPQSGDYFLTNEAIRSGPEDNEGPQLFIINNTPGTNNPYEFQTRGEVQFLSLFAEEDG
jgi:hypothetical protein